jgi:uncharacterized protein YndB with AHSA1/START domain
MNQKSTQTNEQIFTLSRTFSAPRELLWEVCTKPEHMKEWFGPKGFTGKAANMDFRQRGMYHYCLVSPDGLEMWGKFVYREIIKPERIEFVNFFSDADGGLTRHPMSPTWPREMLSVFIFTEVKTKSTLTIEWSPINPSEEERKTFNSGMDAMKQGWTGTFERLEAYLRKLTEAA